MTRRRPEPQPTPCQPTGDMALWVDDRDRTCTLCAEFVTIVATPDGTDWVAIDGAGHGYARAPEPQLCPCYPPDSPLRVRMDTGSDDGSTIGGSRHFGSGLNRDSISWVGGHIHNYDGGQSFYTSLSALPLACGHRLPPTRRTCSIGPPPNATPPPECHGWPMRFAPRGWQCRPTGRYHPVVIQP